MTESVRLFCVWLDATPLSAEIKSVEWLIPLVQTIHILSISLVLASSAIIYLRLFGLAWRTESVVAVANRFVPRIWWSLIVLFLSGATLIIAEPGRALPNRAFLAKISMLAVVSVLTLTFQQGLRKDERYWERSTQRRLAVQVLAIVSLMFWIGIVFAGRWIAYIDVDAT